MTVGGCEGFKMDEQGEQAPETRPGKRAGRMTHSELKTLKTVQTKEEGPVVQMVKGVQGFWAAIFGTFASILPTKKHSSCSVNGHVFPKGTWDGEFPRCTHCGEQITTADQFGGRR